MVVAIVVDKLTSIGSMLGGSKGSASITLKNLMYPSHRICTII